MDDHGQLGVVGWHLSPSGSILFHNAFLHKGLMTSASVDAEVLPGTGSMYGFAARVNPKEQIWERVRREEFPELPSRIDALFAFDDRTVAERAAATWFAGQNRHIIECRIMPQSIVRRADARWLDCAESEWTAQARRYWTGELTSDPMPEIIIHGAVFFPSWREPPFGLFGFAAER